MIREDLIGLFEAIYDVESPEPVWLQKLCDQAHPFLARGAGVLAATFETEKPEPVRAVGRSSELSIERGDLNRLAKPVSVQERSAIIGCGSVVTASECFRRTGNRLKGPEGYEDLLAVIGSPDGRNGVVLAAPLLRVDTPDRGFRRRFSRVATHLSTAFALRERFGGSATGQTHPGPSAADIDLAALAESFESGGEDEAVDIWRGLIGGAWSLVKHTDTEGRRLILAVKNDTGYEDARGLTDRERAVLAYAMLGHPNKLIAFHFNLSAATVSLHLKRALAKLGMRSLADLSSGLVSERDETTDLGN